MRSQGVYPTPEPHRSPVPRGFLPLLAILALIAAVAGLAVMVVRRGPAAPPQVQTPSIVPALVSRPIAYPALPDTKALVARNRIFADEVLASASYDFGASTAAFEWSNEVTPQTGPR